MSVLNKYIARSVLGHTALVLLVLMVLSALYLFTEQQDDIGVGTFSVVDALAFVGLKDEPGRGALREYGRVSQDNDESRKNNATTFSACSHDYSPVSPNVRVSGRASSVRSHRVLDSAEVTSPILSRSRHHVRYRSV